MAFKTFLTDGHQVAANSGATRNWTHLPSPRTSTLTCQLMCPGLESLDIQGHYTVLPESMAHSITIPAPSRPGNANQSLAISAHISLFISTWPPVTEVGCGMILRTSKRYHKVSLRFDEKKRFLPTLCLHVTFACVSLTSTMIPRYSDVKKCLPPSWFLIFLHVCHT